MSPDFYDKLQRAVKSVRAQCQLEPGIAIIAGTGLSTLLADITVDTRISYADIDELPVSTAPGHAGELIFGTLAGKQVVAMNGRFHAYEGWSHDELVLPIYLLNQLGADRLIVTNAAGGLNPDFKVPDIMLISDHLTLQGVFPLTGPNDDRLGVRFPDMSQAYNRKFQQAALLCAKELGLDIQQGVYAAWHGPALETNAERKFCRLAGGDAVGMSTAIEVVAAVHAGMQVVGFSAITNAATGGPDQQPDTVEQIMDYAKQAAVGIRQLVLRLLETDRL